MLEKCLLVLIVHNARNPRNCSYSSPTYLHIYNCPLEDPKTYLTKPWYANVSQQQYDKELFIANKVSLTSQC